MTLNESAATKGEEQAEMTEVTQEAQELSACRLDLLDLKATLARFGWKNAQGHIARGVMGCGACGKILRREPLTPHEIKHLFQWREDIKSKIEFIEKGGDPKNFIKRKVGPRVVASPPPKYDKSRIEQKKAKKVEQINQSIRDNSERQARRNRILEEYKRRGVKGIEKPAQNETVPEQFRESESAVPPEVAARMADGKKKAQQALQRAVAGALSAKGAPAMSTEAAAHVLMDAHLRAHLREEVEKTRIIDGPNTRLVKALSELYPGTLEN